MISEKIGTALKKSTKTKTWWLKAASALVLSNIFFFILFSGEQEATKGPSAVPEGWVEVQLTAELLTPFHSGKRVLIVHRMGRKKLEGVLQESAPELTGKITILVKENEAHTLFLHESWEVLPYLKHLNFYVSQKGENHEIRY